MRLKYQPKFLDITPQRLAGIGKRRSTRLGRAFQRAAHFTAFKELRGSLADERRVGGTTAFCPFCKDFRPRSRPRGQMGKPNIGPLRKGGGGMSLRTARAAKLGYTARSVSESPPPMTADHQENFAGVTLSGNGSNVEVCAGV